jgi:hypothetical protein
MAKLADDRADTQEQVEGTPGSLMTQLLPFANRQGPIRMTEELLELLRQRVASQYYNRPEVVEIIARAILHSRGIYPQ